MGGVNSGSPEFTPKGVFFRYFSWKFRVGPFRGSVAGRGVLKFTRLHAFSLTIRLLIEARISKGMSVLTNHVFSFRVGRFLMGLVWMGSE